MERVWWKEAVGYQVYPRSFQDSNGDGIGDIQGLIQRLDYLQDLGIDLIWICPMYQSPQDDNGYDISDYKAILEEFGTMKDFDELLQKVHERGMKLIIDLVLNHTSDEHPWFIESRSSKESEKRNWYIWRDGKNGQEPNNWESIFGGSAWKYDENTDQYFLHVFSKKQPDLNWENPEVRSALYETVNWWLDKGIDGFRIDAISHIKKCPGLPDMPNSKKKKYVSSFDMHMNQPGIHKFLQEFKEETFGNYDVVTVGEANGVNVEEADLWVGSKGKMNMIFQFEHLDLWDAGTKDSLDVRGLKKVLTRWQKGLEKNGWNALFVENHDLARVVSTWGDDKEYWKESATAIATMYFFMQGTPFIYQGQEIGMTNARFSSIEEYDDVAAKNLYREKKAQDVPEKEILDLLGQTSRDNSRTPMQWSDEKNAGFSTAEPWLKINPNYKKVNVEKQLKDSFSILNYYKTMIKLKKQYDLFTYGQYTLLNEEDSQIYAYLREGDNQNALIVTNLSAKEAKWNGAGILHSSHQLLLNNYQGLFNKQKESLILNPYEARIYLIESSS
ncbi:glycoside hydrolase family 13 protein [Alteribacillus bidgolensis]|uniref:Alpha-amylase n=1 Tax=Alteribacillus bidgolensis TaxID=930129 RepID=A0A1G8LVI1_9BACI|nr:alpha-glucosidase [Alteribacillus bidgolensis]SDI59170.1 alpha-glucosidase [Alteribacillus bidgolensis]